VTEIVNFADHPQSVGEIRANKDKDARIWSPRDALIDVLRTLDRGEIEVSSLIVVFNVLEKGKHDRTSYTSASPDIPTTLGLLARAAYLVNAQE
jgi:hypothetical protein